MRKLAASIVFSLFALFVFAQSPCLPEGITFSTQEQIDNFQSNYPGCTEIEGYVEITGSITNLLGLSTLTSIGGSLWFQQTSDLITLEGLNNVITIGGSLVICNNNEALANLTGLNNLVSIGGHLQIGNSYGGNPSLSSLTGLEGLTTIGSNLWIMENPMLNSLFGLNNLASIGGEIRIQYNNCLISLSGLENINTESVTDLYIYDNNNLSICVAQTVCDYLSDPSGTINIYGNSIGCNNPSEVAEACGFTLPCLPYGNYYFNSQAEIDNFQINYLGCYDLEGKVFISGLEITNLSGLSGINSIGDRLHIHGCDSLTNLTGLDNLTDIGENLIIGGYYPFTANASLVNLVGLEGLTSIGGSLRILGTGNSSLLNLNGLEGLTSIGENLSIVGNDALIDLEGLDNLATIGGYVYIGSSPPFYHNLALTSLYGLDALTTIGAGMHISGNPSLLSISQLANVTNIGGLLEIRVNESLTNLTGLDNIDANTIEDLQIVANDLLSSCEVQSICDYLATPNGTIEIYNNATGCNSPEEVEEACETVDIEDQGLRSFTIHPNPSDNGIITLMLDNPHKLFLICYNTYGQRIQEQEITDAETTINLSTWTPGIYLAVVYEEGKPVGRSKFVVQ